MATITVTLATDPSAAHTGTSLRDAIVQVDAGKANVIAFNIPGSGPKTIAVTSPLPAITRPVTIDGTTAPGYGGRPIVGITRANPTVPGQGLVITGGGSTIKGLAIYGFGGYGVLARGAGGNTFVADYLGVNTTGTAGPGNGGGGLWLDSSGGNTIGGTVAASRNVISNNGGDGIRVENSPGGNMIVGNSIGTDASGTLKLGNQSNGISIANSGGPASATVIALNTVSNNHFFGVGLYAATNVAIQGNTVANNEHRGVAVINSSKITVGGTSSGTANAITGNGLRDGDFDGLAAGIAVVNGSSNVTVVGNAITGNGRGIRISGAGVAGTSPSITIANNTISGNVTQGVLIDDFFGGSSRNVLLTGNAIRENSAIGLRVDNSEAIVIGQAGQAANRIERNGSHGVALFAAARVSLTNNSISSNTGNGVLVALGSVGVTFPSANSINANLGYGVEIFAVPVPLPGLTLNTITGNTKGNLIKH